MSQSAPVVAEAASQYVDLSMGYSRGDFGTGQDSELSQIQVTYGQVVKQYDYSVTLPYLFLSDRYGDDHGIGDVMLRGAMKLGEDIPGEDALYMSIAVKLPTADEKKGLGTGEMDVGGFLSYTHYFHEMQFSVLGGYIITGDSPRQSYHDILVYGMSLARMFTSWYLYASLDGRQQTLETGDDPLEFSAGFFYQINTSLFLKTEALVGLNDASPDHGMTVGVVNWF